MRFKVLLVAVLVSSWSASLAVASPPPGTGKEKGDSAAIDVSRDKRKGRAARLGEECRPRISLILKGTLVSVGQDSLVMDVRRANRHGRLLRGKQLTIQVGARTRIRRMGKAELSALQESDRLKVQVRACKSEAGKIVLLARRIVARPAKVEAESEAAAQVTTDGDR